VRAHDIATWRRRAAARGVALDLRPPIRRGDLMDIGDGGHVLILDGEFGQSLALSIVEVRSFLAGGRWVMGASSMGALRAVECGVLGMHGHGWVHDQYASGAVDSDGDVALLFEPGTFEPVTIPLINVRWLLGQLAALGLVGDAGRDQALRSAEAIHYRRRLPGVLATTWARELPPPVAELVLPALEDEARDAWDRKRMDALAAFEIGLEVTASRAAA
jgi:hypothetical protein